MLGKSVKHVAIFIATILICCVVQILFCQNVFDGYSESVSDTLVNGSFESGQAKSKYGLNYFIFDGWTISEEMNANADTSLKHHENQSLVVNGVSGMKIETTNGVAINGDSYYEFSFMVYSPQKQNATLGLKVDCYNYADKIMDTFSVSGIKLDKDGVWQKLSVAGGTPTLAEYVKIYISIDCTSDGVCYVDNVEIAEKSFLSMVDGASVRLSEETPGIRFSGTVNKIAYDNIKKRYENVSVGIVILPESFYDNITEFTFYGIEEANVQSFSIEAQKWNNADTAEVDGYYGFNCAMVNIKKDNIVKKFCARAYIVYVDNGVEKFLYSDFNLLLNSRSVQEVSLSVIEKEGEFLTEADLAILEYYASGGQIEQK